MWRRFPPGLVPVCILLLAGGMLISGIMAEEGAESEEAPFYVGPGKCKMCHSSPAKGAQYKVWKEDSHAGAFTTLGTPEAREVAAEAGVEGDPRKSARCLACHTTGAAAPAELRANLKPDDAVSCEACHGPGSEYYAFGVMKSVFAGEIEMADVGMLEPTAEVCLACHNEQSPNYESFDFAEKVKLIAHPYPEEFAAGRGREP